MGRLTTHVLDTAHGRPGRGIRIALYRGTGDNQTKICESVTNDDGRCDAPLLEGADMAVGTYVLEFEAGAYFRGQGVNSPDPAFLDTVVIQFGISESDTHYHVPLLLSPYGYSTYRGS